MQVLVVLCAVFAVSLGQLATFKPAAKEGIPGRYVIKLKEDTSVENFIGTADFKSLGIKVRHTYTIIHGLAVEFPSKYIDKLRALPGIDIIYEDAVMRTMQDIASWGLDRIDQRGYPLDNKLSTRMDGTDQKIYVIDTGIRSTHNDFGGRVTYFWDFEPENRGEDCNGHGTHCSGTAAGTTFGIAKNAELYSGRVLACWGSGAWDDLIKALDQLALESGNRIASLSLGGPAYDIVDEAVERLVKAGVVVVIAAGNSNDDACLYTPARAPSKLTDMTEEKEESTSEIDGLNLLIPKPAHPPPDPEKCIHLSKEEQEITVTSEL
ncbi:aqualysin-1-like [Amphiura filiformis]|uniref:aqualysin-1-like n=1 Tax=Amphiura filiformis TaxID=82378 RepID=UPI003B21BAC4